MPVAPQPQADGAPLVFLQEGRRNDWAAWAARTPKPHTQLRGAALVGVDLSGWPLEGADLTGADLKGANLSGANLARAKLWDTRLSSANLGNAILAGAQFNGANLDDTDFSGTTNLRGATFRGTRFFRTRFCGADLTNAVLTAADLEEVDFTDAILRNANLIDADLFGTKLCRTDLTGARLERTRLLDVDLDGATLIDARVYGIAAWGMKGAETSVQRGLVVTKVPEPVITVENLEVAQLMHLLLRSDASRTLLNSLTAKLVLILGRFTAARKKILDALREELRTRNYVPVLFDFTPPEGRTLTETVSTLAHMSRFVVADITDAKSIAQELQKIVPNLPLVPVVPLLLASRPAYGLFGDLLAFRSVLSPVFYTSRKHLLASIETEVIAPAEANAATLQSEWKRRVDKELEGAARQRGRVTPRRRHRGG